VIRILLSTITCALLFMSSAFRSGVVALNDDEQSLTISSHIYFYGTGVDEDLAFKITDEINTLWNGPEAQVTINNQNYDVKVKVTAEIVSLAEAKNLAEKNNSTLYNFVRVESETSAATSVMDVSENHGLWSLQNDLGNSTTAAHEYGHSLGLRHISIQDNDWRGRGNPGIMGYKGMKVDSHLQGTDGLFDKTKRQVTKVNIAQLKLEELEYNSEGVAVIGKATNKIYKCMNPLSYYAYLKWLKYYPVSFAEVQCMNLFGQ